MSTPPVAIDPAHIPAFLTSTIPEYPQNSPFLLAFQSLTPSNSNEPPLRLYIVQQPVAARHRRSFVEIRDLRALCGRDLSSCTDAAQGGNLDLKDAVLIMKRLPDDLPGGSVLTAGTLACVQSVYGLGSIAGSGTSASGDSMRGDRSSNGGDDTCSSFGGDDDMSGGNFGHSGGRVGMSKTWMGADDVASWMEKYPETYLNMCLSEDPSDTAPPPSCTVSFSPTAAQSVAQENDYDSDDIYDDDDDDNDEDDDNYNNNNNNNEESRGGKRVRHSATTNTNAHQDPNQTLPQNFRAQKKNGIIQYEIWVVAFFKPQLLPAPPALATVGGVQLEGYSHWTEILNALLDSVELQQFVRAEVSGGRIGIDFKEIMARKKDKRKSTRRVVR